MNTTFSSNRQIGTLNMCSVKLGYEQMPFWLKLNKGNDFAGEALGNYVVMPYKRVRYRAAFCLQYLGDKPKNIANKIVEKDSAREALRLAIENDNVKKFVSKNMGKLPDLPKNYGIQLLGEFEAIELGVFKTSWWHSRALDAALNLSVECWFLRPNSTPICHILLKAGSPSRCRATFQLILNTPN